MTPLRYGWDLTSWKVNRADGGTIARGLSHEEAVRIVSSVNVLQHIELEKLTGFATDRSELAAVCEELVARAEGEREGEGGDLPAWLDGLLDCMAFEPHRVGQGLKEGEQKVD